jgi:hypothetical protein
MTHGPTTRRTGSGDTDRRGGGATGTLQFQNRNPSAFHDFFAFWDEKSGLTISDASTQQPLDHGVELGEAERLLELRCGAEQPGIPEQVIPLRL